MSYSPKEILYRMNNVVSAWETICPDAIIANLSLEQFKVAIQPSFDARASLDSLKSIIEAGERRRDLADEKSVQVMRKVIDAVRPEAGPVHRRHQEFIAALGYVRKTERPTRAERSAAAASNPPFDAAASPAAEPMT